MHPFLNPKFAIRNSKFLALAFFLLVPVVAVWAKSPMMPEPVDKVVAAVEKKYIAAHPDDPYGYYVVGQAHGLACLRDSVTIPMRADSSENYVPWAAHDPLANSLLYYMRGKALSDDERIEHATQAILSQRKAAALGEKDALYHLALGDALANGAPLAARLGMPPGSATTRPATQPGMAWSAAPTTQPMTAARKAQLDRLIAQLADDSFTVREQAQRQLSRLWRDAVPLLAKHFDDPDAEIRVRIGKVLVDAWRDEAAAEYWRAFELAMDGGHTPSELSKRHGKDEIAALAARGYAAILKERGPDPDEKAHAERAQKYTDEHPIPKPNYIDETMMDW